jgi:hypothetical protein
MKRIIVSTLALGFAVALVSTVFAGTKTLRIKSDLDDHCVVFVNGGAPKGFLNPHGDTGVIFAGGPILGTTEIKINCDDGHVFTNAIENPFQHCNCFVSESGSGLSCQCQ